MRLGTVIQFIGWLLSILAAAMLIPTAVAFGAGDRELGLAFGVCALLTLFAGLGMVASYRGKARVTTLNEGLVLVVVSWAVVPIVAGLPLTMADGISTLLDGWFEAVSGLTTTGATLITDFDAVPSAIFLWRAILQWLGGIYILLTTMHILVVIGATLLPIKRVTLPAPEFFSGGEDITSRILHSLVVVVVIYTTLTIVAFLLIWLPAIDTMRGLEAFCLALSSVSTGGFMTRAGSMDVYQSPLSELVIVVVMIIASMNFVIHWHGIRGRFREYAKVPELQYLALIMMFTVLGVWLAGLLMTGNASLWNALFNGVSLLTTSGFYLEAGGAISDLPPVLVLIPIMIGGAALSTTGGFKVVRFVLLIKHSSREMKRLGHPNGVFPLRFGEYRISEMTMDAVLALFLGFMSVTAVLAFIVGWSGFDFEVALMAAAASVMNAGPFLLAATGGETTYADFPTFTRTMLALGMIIGRVEVLAFFVILNVNFWRR